MEDWIGILIIVGCIICMTLLNYIARPKKDDTRYHDALGQISRQMDFFNRDRF